MYHPNSITGDLHTTHNSLQFLFRIVPLGQFWESDAVHFSSAALRFLVTPLRKIVTNTTIHKSDNYGHRCPVTLFYAPFPEGTGTPQNQRTLTASPFVLPIFFSFFLTCVLPIFTPVLRTGFGF